MKIYIPFPPVELQLARLQELGFSMDDCRRALLVCQGNLNKAFSFIYYLDKQ